MRNQCCFCVKSYHRIEDFKISVRNSNSGNVSSAITNFCSSRCRIIFQGLVDKSIAPESFWADNDLMVCGIDEVGRGSWAGPVVACCLIIDYNKWLNFKHNDRCLITDSKRLTKSQRLDAERVIKECSLEYQICTVSHNFIDKLGIVKATQLAMRKCFSQLTKSKEISLIITDGNRKAFNYEESFSFGKFQSDKDITARHFVELAITKADNHFVCVSAASILAKLYRDRLMSRLDKVFDHYKPYHFSSHVGYGTKKHRKAIYHYGVTSIHRKSFKPIKQYIDNS